MPDKDHAADCLGALALEFQANVDLAGGTRRELPGDHRSARQYPHSGDMDGGLCLLRVFRRRPNLGGHSQSGDLQDEPYRHEAEEQSEPLQLLLVLFSNGPELGRGGQMKELLIFEKDGWAFSHLDQLVGFRGVDLQSAQDEDPRDQDEYDPDSTDDYADDLRSPSMIDALQSRLEEKSGSRSAGA
jgi:hypothetical protein